MNNKKKYDKRVLRSLALISQFGINMLVPIGLMLWLGIWLDSKFGTTWMVLPCFFIGAIAGFQNIYRMAKGLMGFEKDDGCGRRSEVSKSRKEREEKG